MKNAVFAAISVAGLAVSAAQADLVQFNFPITPQQEVPPNNTNVAGAGQLLYDTVAQTFDIDVQMFGLTLAELTGWHIHNAPAGVNGPIVIHLQNLGGVFVNSGQGIRLTMNNVAIGNFEPQLFAHNLYFNVHTQTFGGGHARGQIIPSPAGLALLGMGGLLAAGRRRR